MIFHEIIWWDISSVPVIQVIQVIQVVQVIQLIQAMEVKLAHLWPDCRVIFVWFKRCSLVTLHKIISRPRLLLCILTPSLSTLPACCLVCFVPLRHLLFCRLPLLINELPLLPLWVLAPLLPVWWSVYVTLVWWQMHSVWWNCQAPLLPLFCFVRHFVMT